MYILYTTGGIIVADSANLAASALARLDLSLASGEATAIGIEYTNGVAQSYDAYNNVTDAKNLSDQIATAQYEQSAQTATGIAVGTIAAEVIGSAIAVGVGGAAAAAAAPAIIIVGGIVMGMAGEKYLWQPINDMAKHLLNQDAAIAYENTAKSIDNAIPGDANGNGLPDILESIRTKYTDSKAITSPIILDLDGDGVETTAIGSGTWFDHDANGFAEATGWAGKDDGILVRDLDGNGTIDSGRELFGSETLLANGTKAANGYQALAELDSNLDGKIDANDAAYTTLNIWKDVDGDGITDTGELLTLAEAGVQSLNVGYTASTAIDANGNQHQQIGSYTTTTGTTRAAEDVWFKVDKTNTIAENWVAVSADIAANDSEWGISA